MSMCTCLNRSSGDRKGSTGVSVCFPTLTFGTVHIFLPTVEYPTSREAKHMLMESLAPELERL